MSKPSLLQVIICKCGSAFAACCVPECYTDVEWQRDLRKYVRQGCTVEMNNPDSVSLQSCKCAELKKKADPQLAMF